jgi:hypothetical protein
MKFNFRPFHEVVAFQFKGDNFSQLKEWFDSFDLPDRELRLINPGNSPAIFNTVTETIVEQWFTGEWWLTQGSLSISETNYMSDLNEVTASNVKAVVPDWVIHALLIPFEG